MVATFVKEMEASLFSDSLICNRAYSMSDVRERAVAHIEAEEAILRKNGNTEPKQSRYKESRRERCSKSIGVSTSRRTDQRYVSYITKKDDANGPNNEENIPKLKF